LFGIALPLALIVGHAIARKPTLQNKATNIATNIAENLSLQATPMGLLLSWLGAKSIGEQLTSPMKRK